MNRRDFLQSAATFAGAVSTGAAHKTQAQAQTPRRDLRLVFARGGDLFASPSMDGTDARRVLTLGAANALWAVSPDGRRIVWMVQGESGKPGAAVFLSDVLGRHQKKLLTVGDLRDRQGKSVTRAGVENAEEINQWQPISLGWSADGRTVYVGCGHTDGQRRATFAADGVNGTALVDGDGRWKLLAALSHIDAQGGLLVGLASRNVYPLPDGKNVTPPFGEVVVINLAEGGMRTPLFRPVKVNENTAPDDWEIAQEPALSPDHRSIAYASGPQVTPCLWLRDRYAKPDVPSRKIADGNTLGRPQWSSDGKQIYFLQDAPRAADQTTPPIKFDLYQADVPGNEPNVAVPRLVLKNVDSFALAPS